MEPSGLPELLKRLSIRAESSRQMWQDRVPGRRDPWGATEGPSQVCSWGLINRCMWANYSRWEKK